MMKYKWLSILVKQNVKRHLHFRIRFSTLYYPQQISLFLYLFCFSLFCLQVFKDVMSKLSCINKKNPLHKKIEHQSIQLQFIQFLIMFTNAFEQGHCTWMQVVKLYLLFNPPQHFVSHTLETLDHYWMSLLKLTNKLMLIVGGKNDFQSVMIG